MVYKADAAGQYKQNGNNDHGKRAAFHLFNKLIEWKKHFPNVRRDGVFPCMLRCSIFRRVMIS